MLHALFFVLFGLALLRLSQRGYPLLALLLIPCGTLCCWQLARQRLAGACITWRQGEWQLEHGGGNRAISVRGCSTSLPWLIYLAWIEMGNGRRASVFLLPDSAPAEQLRRLRVRLTLER